MFRTCSTEKDEILLTKEICILLTSSAPNGNGSRTCKTLFIIFFTAWNCPLSNLTPIIISIVVWTFGEMIFLPSGGVFVAEVSPEKRRGEYMGYYQMTFSFSFMIGPWLGTETLDSLGSFILWTGCFVLGVLSAVMMLLLRRKKTL